MAIKKIVLVALVFELGDEKTKEFKLKVASFDKKKQKQLKKFGKGLDVEYKSLNSANENQYELNQKYQDAKESLEDAVALRDAELTAENAKLVVEKRKEFKKLEKKLSKLKKENIEGDDVDEDELQQKIFRKQIELMVVNHQELLEYVDVEGYPYQVIIGEIFSLLGKAQKN